MIIHRYLTILDPFATTNEEIQKEKGFMGKEEEDPGSMKKFHDMDSRAWWKRMIKLK